jgi:hypothetical protein
MKRLSLVSFLSFSLVFLPSFSLAASTACGNGVPSTQLCNPIQYGGGANDDAGLFVFKVISIFTDFFALVALVMVLFSGLRMIVSNGNEESIATAKSSLTWSLAGLVLAMFAFVIVSAVATFIGAQNLNPGSYIGNNPVINPIQSQTVGALIANIIIGFISLAGLLSILMIVVGGFRYVTSQGNEEQAAVGKRTLQWAVVGLVVALLAYVLVRATLTFFGG